MPKDFFSKIVVEVVQKLWTIERNYTLSNGPTQHCLKSHVRSLKNNLPLSFTTPISIPTKRNSAKVR